MYKRRIEEERGVGKEERRVHVDHGFGSRTSFDSRVQVRLIARYLVQETMKVQSVVFFFISRDARDVRTHLNRNVNDASQTVGDARSLLLDPIRVRDQDTVYFSDEFLVSSETESSDEREERR